MQHTTAYNNISPSDWANWQWQQQNRVTTVAALDAIVGLSEREKKHLPPAKIASKSRLLRITSVYLT